jgi:hypothetical protein
MEDIKKFLSNSRFIIQFLAGLHFVWDRVLGPPRRILLKVLGRFFNWYKATWNRYTYDKYGGFVYKRAGIMTTATLAVLIMIPTFISLSFNAALFFTTYRSERVYLFNSEEIYPDDNIWSIRGCEMVNCATESLYFRVAPSLFNQIWSVIYNRELFLADDIASGVPARLNVILFHTVSALRPL